MVGVCTTFGKPSLRTRVPLIFRWIRCIFGGPIQVSAVVTPEWLGFPNDGGLEKVNTKGQQSPALPKGNRRGTGRSPWDCSPSVPTLSECRGVFK